MLKSMLTRVREVREIEGEAADAGFTLIELMVVLLIIAILLAIAIPTFLGVTGSANDRASQSNLTNALTEAKALYQNNSQSYGFGQAELAASAPEFTWTLGTSCGPTATPGPGGPNCVSFTPVDVALAGDNAGFVMANLSKTGTCWYLMTLEATPVATFGTPDTPPAYQAASGTGATGDQGVSTAGSYYSKSTGVGCNATTPLTHSGGWTWGSSYSSAATL